ncbi:UDP-3-O-acylglucosamine N-acyltransferase [Haloferula helveola]|uniref:UDP-3-O-acylglucosamine N-acyltransferase n=1 Tax=Haloferula helveola TaxID=490095 RepID=A0ABN6H5L6_9BACT|nr:UDP-3-O-acylglucosamine N-acyltransferase [Haloferula helveola]
MSREAVALTLSELARQVDGDIVRGEPSFVIEGIASLDEATATELSFLGNERYRQQFLKTRAGAVIVPKGVEDGPEGVALVAAENPSYAFGAAVKHFTAAHARQFEPGVDPRAVIHETAKLNRDKVRIHAGAVVMAGAVIGDGTEIGPNAVVGEQVKIGVDCHVHALVSIRERCVLGDRVIIQPGAVIGSDGFGYETVNGSHVKIDQIGIVVLDDDVEVGANTTIDRARFGRTAIGAGTKIDNLVQIAHNVQLGPHNLIVSQSGIAGSAKTGKYVVLAAQAGIGGHVTIGDQAVFAGRSGATADMEGGQTYGGYPAQPHMDEQRQKAALRKLPDLIKRVKRLEKG